MPRLPASCAAALRSATSRALSRASNASSAAVVLRRCAIALHYDQHNNLTLITAHLAAPYCARLRTTKSQERLNEEVCWRERVIRIVPARAPGVRLLGAL